MSGRFESSVGNAEYSADSSTNVVGSLESGAEAVAGRYLMTHPLMYVHMIISVCMYVCTRSMYNLKVMYVCMYVCIMQWYTDGCVQLFIRFLPMYVCYVMYVYMYVCVPISSSIYFSTYVRMYLYELLFLYEILCEKTMFNKYYIHNYML